MKKTFQNYAICYINSNGVIVETSQELLDLLLFDKSELIGEKLSTFIPLEYIDKYKSTFLDSFNHNNNFLLPIRRKDNKEIYVYAKALLNKYQDESVIKTYIEQIDSISKSLEITSKLLKYEGLVQEVTELSSVAKELTPYLNKVLTIFGTTLDVDHTFIYKYNSDSKEYSLSNAWYHDKSLLSTTELGYSFEENVNFTIKLRNKESHYISDTSLLEDLKERSIFEHIGIKSFINEPLFLQGELYGFIGYNTTLSNRERLVDDISLIQSIAKIISQTMERIIANEKLKQREFFNRIQIDNSSIGMAVFDVKTQVVIEANKQFYEVIGYSKEEYENLDWKSKSTVQEVEEEVKLVTQLLQKKIPSYHINKSWIKKDGTNIFVTLRRSVYWSHSGEYLYDIISYEDTTERTKSIQEIEYLSVHDELTGTYNRRYFENYITTIDHKDNFPLSIVVIDLNGLKLINDAFGHLSGDKMLIEAVNILQKHIDNPEALSRIGGDEFALLLPNTKSDYVYSLFKEIEKDCNKTFINSVQLSLAYGVYTRDSNTNPFYEDFKIAEDEMYRMKLIDVPSMRTNAIDAILSTLFEKDEYSKEHCSNVSTLTARLAEKMGFNVNQVSSMKMAGLLHDIGKIIIPSSILKKQNLLTNAEYIEIKKHAEIGYRILSSTNDFRGIADYVLYHHEHYDGGGYPQQLKGEEIPIESRIISVVDAFDAMISYRSYRKNKTIPEALEELKNFSGTQFDPYTVSVFIEHVDEIINDVYNNYS